MELDQSRLLVLRAAHAIDIQGAKAARKEVRYTRVHVHAYVIVHHFPVVSESVDSL